MVEIWVLYLEFSLSLKSVDPQICEFGKAMFPKHLHYITGKNKNKPNIKKRFLKISTKKSSFLCGRST